MNLKTSIFQCWDFFYFRNSHAKLTLTLNFTAKSRSGWDSFCMKNDYNINMVNGTKKSLYIAEVGILTKMKDIIDQRNTKV